MDAQVTAMIPRALHDIPDPRRNNHRHKLFDMLVIALFAVLGGADGWVAVAAYGQRKLAWLKTFLELPHGIPSHDAFGALFARLNPEEIERCFMQWVQDMVQLSNGRLIAVDGKSLRRSFAHGWDRSGMSHMVSAFLSANHLVFAQVNTIGKGHELEGIEKLLKLLDIKGAVVTIDSLGCTRHLTQVISEGGGKYLLQVKGNQERLAPKLRATLDEAIALDFSGMEHKSWRGEAESEHGRLEQRRLWATWDVSGVGSLAKEFADLRCLIVVESQRQDLSNVKGEVTTTRRYYISSLPRQTSAAKIAEYVRGHWGVENNLHWQLDVSFNEDQCRLRTGHGAENFSRLCRMSLNLLKQETTAKVGIATKRKICGWDDQYLLTVLQAAG
jgi:predicted transposase YbfD/YdcC